MKKKRGRYFYVVLTRAGRLRVENISTPADYPDAILAWGPYTVREEAYEAKYKIGSDLMRGDLEAIFANRKGRERK